MSEIADKQKNECEEIKGVKAFEEAELAENAEEISEKFCPSCIPDPYAPTIDWFLEEDPYFDSRTCEYVANVSFHKAQDVFQNGIDVSVVAGENTTNEVGLSTKKIYEDIVEYAQDQKDKGTEILLRHFGKKVTKENLSLSFIPDDGIIVSSNSVINIKIVIVSERFNALGELTQEDLNEQVQPENNTEFPSTLIINDSTFEFWEKLTTTHLGILAYEGRYSYFRNVDDGVIKYDKEGELTFFRPKHIRDSLDDFKKALDKILVTNGMSLYSVSSFFGIYDTVSKIEIQFDNSNVNKPFKIHKIFATSGNCPRKELFKGLDVFKEKGYLPTALFYMTNFEKAYADLIAPEPRDWLEFFEEYTYPPIQAIYGSSGEEEKIEESGLSCALDVDLGALAAGILEDFFNSAWDIFSNSFDLVACSEEPLDREPALKEYIRPDLQEQYEKFYEEELKRLRKEKQKELQDLATSDFKNITKVQEISEIEEQRAKERLELEKQLEREAAQKAEQKISNLNKKNFVHPFYKHFKNSLKQRMSNDQSLLAIFKKIEKDPNLTSSSKIEKFIESIGLCGISSGFKKALGCLMKQVDIKSLITTAVRTFLLAPGFGVADLSNALRDLLLFLPPEKQVEVQLRIEEKLGKIKPPWETLTANPDQKAAQEEESRTKGVLRDSDGNPLTEEVNGKQVPISKGVHGSDTNKNVASTQKGSQFSQDVSNTINQSLQLILETYLEELLGAASVDELIKKYRKEVPAISEILKFIQGNCNTSPIKDINNSLLTNFKFDVCNPTKPMIEFKIPELKWKPNIWKTFKNTMKKVIREAIMKAITALVLKLVKILEEKLCASLDALGKTGLDLLSERGVDFGQILKDAFCPDATDEEARDLGNSLLNKIGVTDNEIQNAFDCFTGAIFGSMTQREMINLITIREKNPADIQMFIQTIKVGCPAMYDLVNTPSKAENFFNNIGNLIPEDTRNLIQSSIPFSSDGLPFYESICLTSEELRSWDQLRKSGLEAAGLNPQDAADQVDLYNKRAREALADIMDGINNGPNADLNDMIQDLFSPLTDDPCDKKNLQEGESLFGNKVAREPEELVRLQDEVSNRIFDGILDQVTRDFSNSLFLGGSFLERILTDTQDQNQALHNLYKSWIFTRNKYHDSIATQDQKDKKFFFFGLDALGEHRGYYPETVGIYCKQQLENNEIQYDSNVKIIPGSSRFFSGFRAGGQEITVDLSDDPIEQSNFDFSFERENNIGGFFANPEKIEGKVSFLSGDLLSPDKSLSYKIKSSYTAEIFLEDIAQTHINNDGLENLVIEEDASKEYRALVFNAFINKKLEPLNLKADLSNIRNFSDAIQSVFSGVMKIIVNNTEGFKFGFVDEDLTEDDLKYVNPEEGSTAYTYENKDKVLGRSMTNNPRVSFLNPENYGGSYKVPPVYIKPIEKRGWMKYALELFPEEEECEPKSQTIINNEKIKSFVNERRNTNKLRNEEMQKMSEKCYFDKPFDKILTKNAISAIEGLIKIQIRTSITKELIKNMPVVSCIKYTPDNYDSTSAITIMNRLLHELKTINPFGARQLEKKNYYLIFLEQAVQYFISTTVEGLPNKTDPETGEETEEKDFSGLGEDLEKAYKKIKSFTDNFTYLNTVPPKSARIQLLGQEGWGSNFLSSENYNRYAGVYQKVGDYIFSSTSFYDYKPDFLQNETTTNLYSVIFAIRLCEKEAKTILKYLIDLEYEEIMSDFYKRQEPIIDDINKAFLTSPEVFLDNNIKNFGFTQYKQKISIGSFQSMGQPNDVIDIRRRSWFGFTDDFHMRIERYIRLKEKDNLDLPQEVIEVLNSRDRNVRGVVSIENLQKFFDENIDLLGEYNISDLFGDARLVEMTLEENEEETQTQPQEEKELELIGEVGMKTGIRIVMRLPEAVTLADRPDLETAAELYGVSPEVFEELKQQDLNFSNLEKAYYIRGSIDNLSIPVCSAEVEIIDTKIKDLNLEQIYDVDCLARKMVNSQDYKILFKKIIPIQAVSSMVLQYINYFFLDSIGIGISDDGIAERAEEIENPKRIKMPEFNSTNLQIRKYFACFYNTNRGLHSENFRLPRIEFPDFWKMLFGNFSFPEVNLNLILPDGFSFGHKLIEINPFHRDDELCDE